MRYDWLFKPRISQAIQLRATRAGFIVANKQWSMTGFQFEQKGGKLGGLCFPRVTEKAYAECSN